MIYHLVGSILSHIEDLLLEIEIQHPAGSSLRCITSCQLPLSYRVLSRIFSVGVLTRDLSIVSDEALY